MKKYIISFLLGVLLNFIAFKIAFYNIPIEWCLNLILIFIGMSVGAGLAMIAATWLQDLFNETYDI